jgi:hypothetical protein
VVASERSFFLASRHSLLIEIELRREQVPQVASSTELCSSIFFTSAVLRFPHSIKRGDANHSPRARVR